MLQSDRLVFQPQTYRSLLCGVNQLVDAIRPTFGPQPRYVGVEKLGQRGAVDLLDSGGLIARRMIQLQDRHADMGAMLARQMLCELHEQYGDGTTTAALVFQSVLEQGIRYITAGGNAMRLRVHIESFLPLIRQTLQEITQPVGTRTTLENLVRSLCHDTELAPLLTDIFAQIGPYGHLDTRVGQHPTSQHAFTEGAIWSDSGVLTRTSLEGEGVIQLDEVALLISDLSLDDPRDFEPIVRAALKVGARRLVIIARDLSEKAAAFVATNSKPDKFQIVCVKTPHARLEDQFAALEDLSVLTGGEYLLRGAGMSWANVTPQHLGRAQRVWANRFAIGVISGASDPGQLEQHKEQLLTAYEHVEDNDHRRRLQVRLAHFQGTVATLWVGGMTETEIKTRHALVEQTVTTLRDVMLSGVLPGGGMALLHCRQRLQALECDETDLDRRAAQRILSHALQVPLHALLDNTGIDMGVLAGCIIHDDQYYGCDVLSGNIVNMHQAGILDSAVVQEAVVTAAIKTAALMLTIDTLVHHRIPQEATTP